MNGPSYKQEEIDEIHEEIIREQERERKNPFRHIHQTTITYFGVAIVIAFWYIANNPMDTQKTFFLGIVFALVLYMLTLNAKGPRMLTEQECKIMLYQKLKWKQKNPLGSYTELPDGELQILDKTRLRFLEQKPWKRESGFNIVTVDGFEIQYSAEQDPFTGDPIAIYLRPEGFDPKERSDIKYIPGRDLQQEMRRDLYGGRR